jgi:hypothetical protein
LNNSIWLENHIKKDVKIERVPTKKNLVDSHTEKPSQSKYYHQIERYDIWYMSDWLWCKWKIVSEYAL